MAGLSRTLTIKLALIAAMVCPCGSEGQSTPSEQTNSQTGKLVVTGEGTGGWLPNVRLTLRVHSLKHSVDVTVTVENLTQANFDELVPDEYVLNVSGEGYPPAQLNVVVNIGQSAGVVVEVIHGPPAKLSVHPSGAKAAVEETKQAETDQTGPAHEEMGEGEEKAECAMENVIPATSKQVEQFVENVNRISATEVLEHERLNKNGKVIERGHRKFNYVAMIAETMPGALNVDEYRDGSPGQMSFPGEMATVGMPSLVLIFHPSHVNEFEMNCEGPRKWHGRAVWKVRFEQRLDRPVTMSVLQVGSKQYDILLKGEALIDAENYQVVHLETDLLQPIPKVKLYAEHQALDYGPVPFEENGQRLWLPLEGEIYLDAGGKQYRHRHIYSDYRIFTVDTREKVGSPK
jgi:hypothetical protein